MPPIILAVESSTQVCSLALATPQGVFEHSIIESQQHSMRLLPAIQQLLAQADCIKPDVLAVGIGPGAFTSLRIAVGAVQGLALGWGCPVVGINTLAVLAQQARRSHGAQSGHTVLTALDARMGEVYTARHEFTDSGLRCLSTASAALYAMHAALPDDWCIGNAAALMPHWAQLGRWCINASPQAIDVLNLAEQGLASGDLSAMDAALVQPLYIRNQVALTEAQRRMS